MIKEGLTPNPANSSRNLEKSRLSENKDQEITHNCGIVGFYYNEPTSMTDIGNTLPVLLHRGQEGAGVLSISDAGEMLVWKTDEPLVDPNNNPEYRRFYKESEGDSKIAIGHTRYSTSGRHENDGQRDFRDARQPFASPDLVTAHNGTLTNPKLLPEYMQGSPSDSWVLHESIRRAKGETMDDKIRNVLPGVEGAYSLILADPKEKALYGICDPQNMRPLVLGTLKENRGYVFASEPVAIEDMCDEIEDVKPGEGIKIMDGQAETFFSNPGERASCIFESIYFSRPESTIFGMNSGEFRAQCGEKLAKKDDEDGFEFDAIVPVIRSGLKASEGYLNYMNTVRPTPFVFGLSRNESHSSLSNSDSNESIRIKKPLRTFIFNGDTKSREEKVRQKFKVDTHAVKGKSLVLVDDTLVRSTTSRVVTEMMREAGATEVHWRFAAPPVEHPCYWGIDFPTREELLAANKSDEEIAEIIGADSVRFLDMQSMKDIAENLSGHDGFCTHCFSGEKPMEVNIEHMILKNDIKSSKQLVS